MGLWHPDTIDGQIAHQIDACDHCEPDRRPRMFVCDYHEGWIAALDWLPELPEGPTDFRFHRNEDGTWTATPMRRGTIPLQDRYGIYRPIDCWVDGEAS